MSTGKVYKQAIRRVFAKKYQDELMAVYWGREDDAIHVITTLRHYVHKIAIDQPGGILRYLRASITE